MQRYLKLVTPAAALAGGYFAGYAAAPKVQEATGALDIAPPELVGHKRTQVEGGSFSTRMREAEEKQREEGAPARRQEVWFGFKEIRGGIGELYDIKQQVGEGSFGRTYVAVDKKTGREVALKILPKQMISCADSIEDVDREVEIMKQLNGHENVISFHQAFEDKKAVFISMELCRGGELFDAVQESKGNYTEREAADIIRQILSVLAHCHINGIVYCDVKPENFLYLDKKQKVLKAIDFGLSRHFTPLGRALRKPRGTAYYVAPEVMRCEYGPEADMWSAGIIAYLLLTGEVSTMVPSTFSLPPLPSLPSPPYFADSARLARLLLTLWKKGTLLRRHRDGHLEAGHDRKVCGLFRRQENEEALSPGKGLLKRLAGAGCGPENDCCAGLEPPLAQGHLPTHREGRTRHGCGCSQLSPRLW